MIAECSEPTATRPRDGSDMAGSSRRGCAMVKIDRRRWMLCAVAVVAVLVSGQPSAATAAPAARTASQPAGTSVAGGPRRGSGPAQQPPRPKPQIPFGLSPCEQRKTDHTTGTTMSSCTQIDTAKLGQPPQGAAAQLATAPSVCPPALSTMMEYDRFNICIYAPLEHTTIVSTTNPPGSYTV